MSTKIYNGYYSYLKLEPLLVKLKIVLNDFKKLKVDEYSKLLVEESLAIIDKKSFGDIHPNIAIDLSYLSSVLFDKGRFDDADLICKQALDIGMKDLDLIFPKQYKPSDKKSHIKTAGGNKLRSTKNEVFFICKRTNGNGYCDAFSKQILSNNIAKEFNESVGDAERVIKVMEEINKKGDIRFEYDKIIGVKQQRKNLTQDHLYKHAKKSNTPYIRFDVQYDDFYGVISTIVLADIQNKI